MQPHTILALFTLLINHSIPSKCLQIPVHHPALGETLSVERLTLNKSLAPDQAKLLPMQQKKLVGLKGNPTMTGCWLGEVTVGSQTFLSLIDSGSSDLLIPAVGLNDYTGPGYNTEGKTRLSSTVFRGRFADNSSWVGQYYSDTVTIGGGVATSPFAVMTEQSTEVLVVDGQKSQGLIGIGFDPLSIWQQTTPKTLLSSLLSSRAITRDAVAFRGCPASSSLSSLMDLGIEDLPSLSCPNSVIHWANVPEALYYAVNVMEVAVDGVGITLGSGWQGGGSKYSLVDSCSTTLILPGFVFQRVYDAIMQSGLLQQILSARQLELMMSMNFGYNIADTFPYDRLPVIQVTLESKTPGQKLTLSLTGRTYFQADNEGFVFFMARNGGTQYTNIILGAVVFDTFMIVLDRENRRVGFAPGCECRNVANGIRVSTGGAVAASPSVIASPVPSPNSGNSTATVVAGIAGTGSTGTGSTGTSSSGTILGGGSGTTGGVASVQVVQPIPSNPVVAAPSTIQSPRPSSALNHAAKGLTVMMVMVCGFLVL